MASLVSLGNFAGGLGGALQKGFADREREKAQRGQLDEQRKGREAKAKSDALKARRDQRTNHLAQLTGSLDLISSAVAQGRTDTAQDLAKQVRNGFQDFAQGSQNDGDALSISPQLFDAKVDEALTGLGPAALLRKKTEEAGAIKSAEADATGGRVRAKRTIEETTEILGRPPTEAERARIAKVAPSDAATSKALLDGDGNVKPAVSNSIRQFTAQLFGGLFSPETGNFSLLDKSDAKRALELGAAAEALIAGGHEHSVAAAVYRAAKARGIEFPKPKLEQDAIVDEAEAAVARGASRKAVAERMESEGVDPETVSRFRKKK